MPFVPRPAAPSLRALAGLIDAAIIGVLSGAAVVTQVSFRGVVQPLWGVLLVMLGCAVVPLAAFKRTVGLHVMGLEVVNAHGRALDLVNAGFRELIGRGAFPLAYLLTLGGGLLAVRFGVAGDRTLSFGFGAPSQGAALATAACAIAFVFSLIGHATIFSRPDGRSLADLLSGSFVVAGPALPEPTDLEEFDEHRAHQRRVLRNVVLVELALGLALFAFPTLMNHGGGERAATKVERLKLEAVRAKFERDPASSSLHAELVQLLGNAGRDVEAKEVTARHAQALGVKELDREGRLRERFAQQHDRDTAQQLISLLDEQNRFDEAREVYLELLGPSPTPPQLVGFGNWLATGGHTDEAIAVLTQATTLDPLVPLGQTLLGACLFRAERYTLAREHLELALADDPTDEDAADVLKQVEVKTGPLPAGGKRDLKLQVERWKRAR